jgi:thioesterase domain-containing protein
MEPFPGRIDVILAECSIWSVLEEHVDPRAGWSKLAGKGVAVHHAPGSHLTMINHPNVETLTALLREIFASW